MSLNETFLQAARMAEITSIGWLSEAATARKSGDHAFRERCLSQAKEARERAVWYTIRAALYQPEKIEQKDAA